MIIRLSCGAPGCDIHTHFLTLFSLDFRITSGGAASAWPAYSHKCPRDTLESSDGPGPRLSASFLFFPFVQARVQVWVQQAASRCHDFAITTICGSEPAC